ncbi:MAG TPA: ABC transporter ATP-binding protein [Anaerolineaceae bacterium]|nr:ABC transporter ATP-binding protein [Anaerolineaceae bacterium]HPC05531.1 ABC transporter ATP-binding protein [Anaerolineaceae bacterium]HQN05130.1 ABC transporter ATP-binding protein [Anaerolineaceae bacterium]HQP08408.1 ABC transporter ATP-binding protein [Anaerolineaceae bacterium]
METPIIVKNLTKKFGDVVAVNNVSITIEPHEFLTLLGPSGCGKTTLLRCIAGLEDPDDGEIYIGDKLIYSHVKGISVPPGQRELGMVFQNYALWPHMTVYKNMTFALEIQKLSKEEMDRRVKESLEEVKMSGYEDRYPREMSGGQQQRIALARMLAYRPRVFLMDEPLSNLDARLRMDMRTELKRLHHISDATTLYVTHDQLEAMTMSSKIAVMKLGVIQQLDTPDKVYHFPGNLFVADFIGNPKINLMPGWVSRQDLVDMGKFNIPVKTYNKRGDVVVGLRPEDIIVHDTPTDNTVEFTAYSVLPSGADTTIIAHMGDTELIIKEMGVSKIQMDQKIWLSFKQDAINLYDKETEDLIQS